MRNCFWLKDVAGRKLPDAQAELVAERLQDFVQYCTPDEALLHSEVFGDGPITVGAGPAPAFEPEACPPPHPLPHRARSAVGPATGRPLLARKDSGRGPHVGLTLKP